MKFDWRSVERRHRLADGRWCISYTGWHIWAAILVWNDAPEPWIEAQ